MEEKNKEKNQLWIKIKKLNTKLNVGVSFVFLLIISTILMLVGMLVKYDNAFYSPNISINPFLEEECGIVVESEEEWKKISVSNRLILNSCYQDYLYESGQDTETIYGIFRLKDDLSEINNDDESIIPNKYMLERELAYVNTTISSFAFYMVAIPIGIDLLIVFNKKNKKQE